MARARQSAGQVLFPGSRLVVDPSPEQIRRDLMLLERNISDYNLPLAYSKQALIDDVKAAFDSEVDPVTGIAWKKLSDRAAREARVGILQRTVHNRRMYRAVTSKQNWGVTKQGVFINTRSVLRVAPYAPLHQQDDKLEGPSGTVMERSFKAMGIKSKTDIVKMASARAASTGRSAKFHIAEVLSEAKSGEHLEASERGGGRIPQRRFIGPSPYTQDKLVKVFDRWASNAIIIYRRGGTVIVSKRRAGTA